MNGWYTEAAGRILLTVTGLLDQADVHQFRDPGPQRAHIFEREPRCKFNGAKPIALNEHPAAQ